MDPYPQSVVVTTYIAEVALNAPASVPLPASSALLTAGYRENCPGCGCALGGGCTRTAVPVRLASMEIIEVETVPGGEVFRVEHVRQLGKLGQISC